jgi:hypothetical protein
MLVVSKNLNRRSEVGELKLKQFIRIMKENVPELLGCIVSRTSRYTCLNEVRDLAFKG